MARHIVAYAAFLLLAVGFTPAAHAEGLALVASPAQVRLAGAAAHICAFSGQQSRECEIARSGKVQWFSPRRTASGFEAGGRFNPPNVIQLADSIPTQASLGALFLHEITHQIDAEHARCCWPNQCMATERHAYAREYEYWRWIRDTFGTPQGSHDDGWTGSLNMFLWGDLTDRVEQMAQASCQAV